MHPTIFQLRAFGQFRLAPPVSAAVIGHLASGCGACRAKLAPWLIPWLDEEPAAEARATDAARCGPRLAVEFLRAARRVARAAARQRADDAAVAADRDMQRVGVLLQREGPQAIGRLPRRLLGRPAVAALLRQIRSHQPDIPQERLRLAEMAWDLAERERAMGRRPALRLQAGVELANAYRAVGEMRTADEWLDRMAASLAGRGSEPCTRARLEEVRASLLMNVGHEAPAQAQASLAVVWSRRNADAAALARCLTINGACMRMSDDFDLACDLHAAALRVADPVRHPYTVWAAVTNHFRCLVEGGDWRRARRLLHGFRSSTGAVPPGRRAYHWHRCHGSLLGHEGDCSGALHAFARAREECRLLGDRYSEGVCLIDAAAFLEHRGDGSQAALLLGEAADLFLARQPHHHLYVTVMLLRNRPHFSSLREALPLDRVGRYLDRASFNEDIRLERFLA